jgi:acyl-CoA synthetase (NDP forming)
MTGNIGGQHPEDDRISLPEDLTMATDPAPSLRITPARMESLFAPRSIAIVGASDSSLRSQTTFENLTRGEFAGEVYCVNPRREVVHGQKAYPSLLSLPEPVDLAYLVVGRDAVPSVMADAAEAGVNNLAVIAAGFAEAGPDGKERQQQLIEFANQHGQLVLGPNNLGFINSARNVFAFSQRIALPFLSGGVSLISQSGAMCKFALDYILARDIGLCGVVTVGNEAVINVSHAIEYFLEDPNTRVIALFIESIREPDAFRRLAERALTLGKPIVVCKIGRSTLGARAAAAHTASLVGNDEVIDAAFRQLGVIRVDSVEDLGITAGLLDSYGVFRGSRVGIVTSSGAMAGVISDIAERDGIELPDFSRETVDTLRSEILPPFATPQNPLDVTGQSASDPTMMQRAEGVVIHDPNVDVVVVQPFLPVTEQDVNPDSEAILRQLAETVRKADAQVVLVSYLMSDFGEFTRKYRAELGLPLVLPGVEKGLPALARALWWSERFRTSAGTAVAGERPVPPVARDTVDGAAWSEATAREYINAAGVPVVPGDLVTTVEAAVDAADRLGYPVALKAVSASLLHKSEIGAVVLNLRDPDAVRIAYRQVTEAAAGMPDLEGVLVTTMRHGGIEMIVGVVQDPLWGPVLAVGLGGIWVEVMRDVARRLLPVDRAEIRRMLDELQASALLHGVRGQEPADLEVLADVIFRIASSALALGDRLDALEVNPLWVSGSQVEALDVLVTKRP